MFWDAVKGKIRVYTGGTLWASVRFEGDGTGN